MKKRNSTPRHSTQMAVKRAMEMVKNGTMVKDAIVLCQISHTAYKDTKRWLANEGA